MTQTRSIPDPRQQAGQIEDAARLLRNVLMNALLQAGLGGGGGLPPLRVARAAASTAPALMAAEQAAADAATRRQIAASYESCLANYRALEPTRVGEPGVDDVGLAVAFFVAINLRVLHGIDADADMLRALEQQLRGVARTCSNWETSSIEQRQTFFERTAIAAVALSASAAHAVAQGPQAVAHVQHAARQYVEQMLGMNPDVMTLGPRGLTLREAGAATPATAEQTA